MSLEEIMDLYKGTSEIGTISVECDSTNLCDWNWDCDCHDSDCGDGDCGHWGDN